MRKISLFLSFAILLMLYANHTFAVKHIVSVSNFQFSPAFVNATVGDTMRWQWVSGIHTTTSTTIPAGSTAWNSQITSTITSFEYKITVAGTYNYKCALHAGMLASFTAVTPPPPLSATASANPLSILAGQTSQLDVAATGGTGTYSYLWSSAPPGFTSTLKNPVASPMVTTNYTCQVTSGTQNVSSSVTVTIVPPATRTLQNISIFSGQVFCYDAAQTITVGPEFSAGNGSSVTLIAGQNILLTPGTVASEGSYLHGYITMTGQYCQTLPVPVIAGLGIDGEGRPNSSNLAFRIFPNPTAGSLTIEINSDLASPAINLEVFGPLGEPVMSGKLGTGGRHELSIAGLPAGIYFVRLISGSMAGTRKIIKQD